MIHWEVLNYVATDYNIHFDQICTYFSESFLRTVANHDQNVYLYNNRISNKIIKLYINPFIYIILRDTDTS